MYQAVFFGTEYGMASHAAVGEQYACITMFAFTDGKVAQTFDESEQPFVIFPPHPRYSVSRVCRMFVIDWVFAEVGLNQFIPIEFSEALLYGSHRYAFPEFESFTLIHSEISWKRTETAEPEVWSGFVPLVV